MTNSCTQASLERSVRATVSTSNENLKHALLAAGLTVERFAEIIQVDPKTVQRWVAGATVPYQRNQATVAQALDLEPHDLWPESDPEPTARVPGGWPSATGTNEVTDSWGQVTEPGAPSVLAFISDAGVVDVLDDRGWLLDTPGILDAIAQRAAAGAQVRMLTTRPARELGPLRAGEQTEIRQLASHPSHALIATSVAMLITIRLDDQDLRPPPLLRVHRRRDDGLFERMLEHYDRLWDHADQTPGDADGDHQRQPPVDPSRPAAQPDPTSPDATVGPPRRWPRRSD